MSNEPQEPQEEPKAAAEGAPAEKPEIVEAAPEPDPKDVLIQELDGQVRDLQSRLRAVSKAFTEQQEEMQAYRERVEAQNRVTRARREAEVVRTFFEPVQNLKRSLDAGVGDAQGFLNGIRMIHASFMDGLTRLGLEPIPGVGSTFDPNVHEALAVQPVADPSMDGKVLHVHVDGFMIDGKALRAAQVVIGKHVAEESAAEA